MSSRDGDDNDLRYAKAFRPVSLPLKAVDLRILPSLVLCLLFLCHPARASDFVFSNARGPHAVGLRVVQQYDFSRAYGGKTDPLTAQPRAERARPVQTLVWYPAIKGGAAVHYGDYIRTAVTEDRFGLSDPEVSKLTATWVEKRWAGLSATKIRAEMDRPMWATRDAKPQAGKFPVVIYAPSFGASAHENADLCEFLASHGYVVLSSPSLGASGRDMTHDLDGAEAQVADIEFLIGYARSLPDADADHVGVLGYSWGGMANVLAAAKDSRIGALVSLDGSVRYFPTLVASAKYAVPARLSAPFLFVGAHPYTIDELLTFSQDMSGSLMNQMKYADLYRITMAPMVHANFTSEYQRFALDNGWGFADYDRDETSLGYSWTARYVRRFLDGTLKGDATGLAFVANKPAANGVPAHMLTVNVRLAQGLPPTLDTFATSLGKQGFDHAIDVYRGLRKDDPAFQLSEADLRHWGYQLLFADKTREAIKVFELVTVLFPTSGNAFDCLAEAYEKAGETATAKLNYAKSLELDPKNDNAVQHLKMLNGA